jgi:hypothetical protein
MVLHDPNMLTKEQKEWFGNRMDETQSGRVIVPSYLFEKFRKITGRPELQNHTIKSWLIDYCY